MLAEGLTTFQLARRSSHRQNGRQSVMTDTDEPAEYRPAHIVRDRDSKFTAQFCTILETDGLDFRPIAARSPNLNPYAGSWVAHTKQEVLDHFVVFGEQHLRHILASWLDCYHRHRPHQGLGNVPIDGELPPALAAESVSLADVVCRESLGGLLKRYERKAA